MAADSAPLLLSGKVVVVCGIGPGLGRALAVQSARAGADVVLASRTEGLSKEVAAEITAMGRRAVTVMTDVTDDELAAGLPAAALEAFGRVDALVNNAFAIPPLTSLGDIDLNGLRDEALFLKCDRLVFRRHGERAGRLTGLAFCRSHVGPGRFGLEMQRLQLRW